MEVLLSLQKTDVRFLRDHRVLNAVVIRAIRQTNTEWEKSDKILTYGLVAWILSVGTENTCATATVTWCELRS